MSLSVKRSVVEQFSFNGKKVQSVHVKGEECLVSRDVYMAIGYEQENGKKAIQNLVPEYKLRFVDVKLSLNQGDDIFPLHKDTVLLKEPGLYCFLLRCKRIEAEPFMEWVVETVLPQEVRKLASVIEKKDNQIQAHQQKILRLDEKIDDLIKNRHVSRRGYFDNVLCFIKKNSKEAHQYYVIQCQYTLLGKKTGHKINWVKLLVGGNYSHLHIKLVTFPQLNFGF